MPCASSVPIWKAIMEPTLPQTALAIRLVHGGQRLFHVAWAPLIGRRRGDGEEPTEQDSGGRAYVCAASTCVHETIPVWMQRLVTGGGVVLAKEAARRTLQTTISQTVAAMAHVQAELRPLVPRRQHALDGPVAGCCALLVWGSQAGEDLDVVHDFDGVLAAVGNGCIVIEVAVSRAQDISAADYSGDDVVVVRIVRHHVQDIVLWRVNTDGGGSEEGEGLFYLLVIEPVDGPHARVAKDPAQFVQEKTGDNEDVRQLAESLEAFFCRPPTL